MSAAGHHLPLTPPMLTPAFLAWAIEQTCPLRDGEDGSHPERTERQLRSVRAVSDARREGRVFEGVCVQPPDGFRIAEALALFGGEEAARKCCLDCPANALASLEPDSLAGCYGLWPLPDDPQRFCEAFDQSAVHRDAFAPVTTPRWYGLWLDSPLAAERLLQTQQVLDLPEVRSRPQQELLAALQAAYETTRRLHVRLYPPGRVEGGSWRLVSHCPRCRAAWFQTRSRKCRVCGYLGAPAQDKKRLARGRRPYFPLERLLGAQQAAEFLVKYAARRARREQPGRASSLPPPAPLGNPRAD